MNGKTKPRVVSLQRLYCHLIVSGVIASALFFGNLAASYHDRSNLLLVIYCAGALGAIVSNANRLGGLAKNVPELQSDNSSDKPPMTSTVHALQLYASLLVSGALGFVCYGIFLSGLLEGGLFPKFNLATASPYTGMKAFLESIRPATNLDAAKAIVWAFIAGYSEKFIPNALDKLTRMESEPPKAAPEVDPSGPLSTLADSSLLAEDRRSRDAQP